MDPHSWSLTLDDPARLAEVADRLRREAFAPPEDGRPHLDLNGNGLVWTEDFTFIQVNFLAASETDCCVMASPAMTRPRGDRPLAQMLERPVTRISIEELERRGLGDLIVADLNHDGWLDVRDMEAFMSGARP